MLKKNFATKPQLTRRGSGLPNMVRLYGTDCHDSVRPVLQRLGHGVLELARLIAARRKSCAIISFNVEFGAAKMLGKPRQVFKRCG